MATYACTDLHGQKDLLVKIQKFLQPDDVVFFDIAVEGNKIILQCEDEDLLFDRG